MKIVAFDNYDREYITPILVATNVHPIFGKDIIDFIQENTDPYGNWSFALKPDDYTNYEDHTGKTQEEMEKALDIDPRPYRIYEVIPKP